MNSSFADTAKGKEVIKALDEGTKLMKEQRIVDKAYRGAGFFNVKEWKKIIGKLYFRHKKGAQ